jgi:catechol 2,3-dioxygenase-like lactoylglutathione lyase family enzyme
MLFFRAVYGFKAENEHVLPDPYGLVKSRVLHSPDGSIRIPLNISENRNTAIARSVSTYRGSGVQHIAFATDDIFAAVAAARESGVPLLEIPRNYYDDLAARFDLPAEFIAAWRRPTSCTTAMPKAVKCCMCTPPSLKTASSLNCCNAVPVTSNMVPPMWRCAWPPRRSRARGSRRAATGMTDAG